MSLRFTALGCSCGWVGDFFEMTKYTNLIVKVKVLEKFSENEDFNTKMRVEILTKFKGQESRESIIVTGDDGKECRPYIDYFELDSIYYLSLYNYESEYEQSNCGELYLSVVNGKVNGESGIREGLAQVGEMSVEEFEVKLKSTLQTTQR